MPRFREEIWQEEFKREQKKKKGLDDKFASEVGKKAGPDWQDVSDITDFPETDTSGFELAKLIGRLNPGVEVRRGKGGKSIEVRRPPEK
jgi:hypothetical protein